MAGDQQTGGSDMTKRIMVELTCDEPECGAVHNVRLTGGGMDGWYSTPPSPVNHYCPTHAGKAKAKVAADTQAIDAMWREAYGEN